MKKAVVVLCFVIMLLLLVSGIAAAGFWQDITGMFSLSKLFKTKTTQQALPSQAEKAVTTECKVYIDGKCATELQPKLNMNLQKSAKAYTLESQKAKTVGGKTVKVSKTEKTITHNVMIGTQTKTVKVPVVNVCISNKCKDYGIDESVEISGIVYDMVLVKDNVNLIPKGVPLVSPHEEDISEIDLPPLRPMIQPKIQIVMPPLRLLTPHIFKIGIIIDRDTVPIPQASREEMQEVIRLANDKLRLRSTNIQFELQDIQNVNMGGYDAYGELGSMEMASPNDEHEYVINYYMAHIASPPNGIIIFREDSGASSLGGYGLLALNLIEYGFCNNFQSPELGDSSIYGAILDWDHRYGHCGYDEVYDETNGFDGNRISSISVDGECRNMPGTPCVFRNGYYMCSNIDFENDEYARTRLSFLANTIIHEFLHSFHPTEESLNAYHFGGRDCPESDCDSDFLECAEWYSGMCPLIWANFANSWQSSCNVASTITRREVSPMPTGCRSDADCRAGQRCQSSTGRCLTSSPAPST